MTAVSSEMGAGQFLVESVCATIRKRMTRGAVATPPTLGGSNVFSLLQFNTADVY